MLIWTNQLKDAMVYHPIMMDEAKLFKHRLAASMIALFNSILTQDHFNHDSLRPDTRI
jgi:hypothetical protein